VSGVDVAPTILDLLGLPPLPERHGASLVEAMAGGRSQGRYAYSETRLPRDEFGWSMLAGVRDDRWAWVRAPRPELYDLESDAGEMTSLHEERPELAERLDSIVEGVLTGERKSIVRSALTEEQIEALRSLGYVFSAERPPSTGEDPKDMMNVQEEKLKKFKPILQSMTPYELENPKLSRARVERIAEGSGTEPGGSA